MALVQITENTLRAFLADAEIAAFDSAGAEGDSPERAGALIRTTCNLVAGIVNSSGKYPVLATGQDRVPEELEHPTLVWIRHAMLADLPDMGDLEGSPRAKQYSTAGEIFRAVREGRFYLAPYDSESDGAEVYGAGQRKAHAQHQGIRSQHALHFLNDRDAASFPYQHGFAAKSLFQRLLGGKTELGIRIAHVSIPAMAPPEFHRDALGGMFLYMFFQQGFNPFRLLSRHQAA